MKFRSDLYKTPQEQIITEYFANVYGQSYEVARHSAKSLINHLKSENIDFCESVSDDSVEKEKLKQFYNTQIGITIQDGLDLLYRISPTEARRRLKETLNGYFDRDGNPRTDAIR